MIVITKREKIGTIHNKSIYRVAAFQILPLASNLSGLNEDQVNKKKYEQFVLVGLLLKIEKYYIHRELKNKALSIFLKLTLRTTHFIILMSMI